MWSARKNVANRSWQDGIICTVFPPTAWNLNSESLEPQTELEVVAKACGPSTYKQKMKDPEAGWSASPGKKNEIQDRSETMSHKIRGREDACHLHMAFVLTCTHKCTHVDKHIQTYNAHMQRCIINRCMICLFFRLCWNKC